MEEKFGSEYLNKIVIVDENDKEVIYEKVKGPGNNHERLPRLRFRGKI